MRDRNTDDHSQNHQRRTQDMSCVRRFIFCIITFKKIAGIEKAAQRTARLISVII